MLRFILGKSGSGKSTETLKIAGELADSNLPVMLIVPDQSTFECEKTLLDVFGARIRFFVRVITVLLEI